MWFYNTMHFGEVVMSIAVSVTFALEGVKARNMWNSALKGEPKQEQVLKLESHCVHLTLGCMLQEWRDALYLSSKTISRKGHSKYANLIHHCISCKLCDQRHCDKVQKSTCWKSNSWKIYEEHG